MPIRFAPILWIVQPTRHFARPPPAIRAVASDLTLRNTVAANCRAEAGTGGFLTTLAGTTVTMEHVDVSNCTAQTGGMRGWVAVAIGFRFEFESVAGLASVESGCVVGRLQPPPSADLTDLLLVLRWVGCVYMNSGALVGRNSTFRNCSAVVSYTRATGASRLV